MASLRGLDSLTVHYAYFILMSAIGSVILYTTATPIHELHYTDALFMSFSAMTGTGLNVVDLATLNGIQQGTLLSLLVLGHAIFILGVLSFLRARTLRSVLKDVQRKKVDQTVTQTSIVQIQTDSFPEAKDDVPSVKITSLLRTNATVDELPDISTFGKSEHVSSNDYDFMTVTPPDMTENCQKVTTITVIGDSVDVCDAKTRMFRIVARVINTMQQVKINLSSSSIGCDEPGWAEYKALSLISALVVGYYVAFLSFGILCLGLWMKYCRPEIAEADGVSPFWTGAFLATSAFANNGMSLLSANMGPFQRDAAPLLVTGLLILVGNTLFPCLLRLSIWVMRKMIPEKPAWHAWRRVFDLTLTRSQDVCAYLYPSWHTWFLFGTILMLNSIMWGAFELAAINTVEIAALSPKYRVLDGLFQSLAVRGGGFSVVAFDGLPQALLILYALMMYLSAFPVSTLISGREALQENSTSTFDKERDLTNPPPSTTDAPRSTFARGQFFFKQLRSQFSHDIWLISLVVLLVTVAESDHYKTQPVSFSTFNIIFEIISAYSCVGVSIGYPGKSYAFCGEWHTFSKILLIITALKGRHRGLNFLNGKAISHGGSWEPIEEKLPQQAYM
ncbi:uncharacterized protein N7511_006830 [Penicillium nucicola]|uniref:uncharacterized protein n=1 Tax=Penicillium nucicola TaxID=1850975 RepID=UPI0025459E1D|nr:uncharacterized protein N7511_006830 [Penicillium nucicola]KAJ5758136.1 hypothetical protein N7511_006830 [Penicillium nucicola]